MYPLGSGLSVGYTCCAHAPLSANTEAVILGRTFDLHGLPPPKTDFRDRFLDHGGGCSDDVRDRELAQRGPEVGNRLCCYGIFGLR